jgi:hypothetical protein
MPLFSVESRTRAPTKRKQKAAQDASKTPKERQGKQKKKKKPLGLKGGKGKPARTEKPGVPHGVDMKDQEGNTIIEAAKGGSVSKFPDLSGDGKVTQKDILMGRGVIKKKRGGAVDTPKKKRGNYGPNIGKPFKAMGPVGGLPVNKAGTKIMSNLAGRLARRGYGKARR